MEECCKVEEWRAVEDTGGCYEVSTCGRARSKFRAGVCLKQTETSAGTGKYLGVRIKYTQGYKTKRVHRLVAETFLDVVDGKTLVLHCDGVRTNNHLSNLRYGDRADNIADDAKHGKIRDWAKVREVARSQKGKPVLITGVNQPVASTINSGRKSGFGPKGTYRAQIKNTENINGSYYGDLYVTYVGDNE